METEIKEIFRSSVATLRYNEKNRLIYLEWNGTITLEKYKEPFIFLLDKFKPEVAGILSDIRKQGIVSPEMRNWLQKEATPKAKERGLKVFYVVSEANVFKQYYVNTILKLLSGDGVERKLFQDFKTAEQAILSTIQKYQTEKIA